MRGFVRASTGAVLVRWPGASGAAGRTQALFVRGSGPLAIRRADRRRLVLLDSHGFRHRLHIAATASTLSGAFGARVARPADGLVPAAGICGRGVGDTVTIAAQIDTPSPRCVSARPDQGIRLQNRTDRYSESGHHIRVAFAGQITRLGVGQSATSRRPLGDYLAPGVHNARFSWLDRDAFGRVW
jgi:hypothetical protein